MPTSPHTTTSFRRDGHSRLTQQHGAPVPSYVPGLADRVTGLHVVYAVAAALCREKVAGQHIAVPMFESVAHCIG